MGSSRSVDAGSRRVCQPQLQAFRSPSGACRPQRGQRGHRTGRLVLRIASHRRQCTSYRIDVCDRTPAYLLGVRIHSPAQEPSASPQDFRT